MRALAAGRFVAATALGAQRWTGPVLLFAVGLGVAFVSGGSVLTTFAQGAAWLFPVTAWLVVATVGALDEGQEAVIAATLRGPLRARLLQVAVAATVSMVLAAASIGAGTTAAAGDVTARQLGLGLTAHVVCALGGCTLGTLCARPLARGAGWGVTVGVFVTVLELAVPHVWPVRGMVDVLEGSGHAQRWPAVALLGAGTAFACAVVGAGGLALARRRF